MLSEVERLRFTMDFLRAKLSRDGRLAKNEWAELEECKLRLQRLEAPEPQQVQQ